jgi:tagatose 6-phosphate kinase
MRRPNPDHAAPARRRIVFVAANPSIDRLIEVDSIALGAINRPDVVIAVPGGKGLNAARTAFALGGRVTALAIVAGRAGEWIAARLDALGIDSGLVFDEGGVETRTCVSALDRSTGRLTEFYEPGPTIRPATWVAFEGALVRQLEAGDVAAVVCSGSLPPGAPHDGYARIVRIARLAPGGSVDVIVDSHGAALAAALTEHPAVVKLNAAEALEAVGDPAATDATPGAADALRAAQVLCQRGTRRVIVTLGEDGAIACEGPSTWRLRSPDRRGAYPVGSGDAFLAGLTVALVDGRSFVEAAQRGMAAGIANAFLAGAGTLDPALAVALVGEVEVSSI